MVLCSENRIGKACILCGGKPLLRLKVLRIELFSKCPIFSRSKYSVTFCSAVGIVHHSPRNINIVACGRYPEMDEKSEICFFEKPFSARIICAGKFFFRAFVADYIVLLGGGSGVVAHRSSLPSVVIVEGVTFARYIRIFIRIFFVVRLYHQLFNLRIAGIYCNVGHCGKEQKHCEYDTYRHEQI